MSYEKDTHIDKGALDYELSRQSDLMEKYGLLLADAQKERDEAKEELDFTKAELDSKIRNNPGKYGIDKLTERAIDSAIILENAYRKANQRLIDAGHRVNIMFAVKGALEHKKDAIGNLVKLYLSGYYSESIGITEPEKRGIRDKASESSYEEQREALSKNPRLLKKRKRED